MAPSPPTSRAVAVALAALMLLVGAGLRLCWCTGHGHAETAHEQEHASHDAGRRKSSDLDPERLRIEHAGDVCLCVSVSLPETVPPQGGAAPDPGPGVHDLVAAHPVWPADAWPRLSRGDPVRGPPPGPPARRVHLTCCVFLL